MTNIDIQNYHKHFLSIIFTIPYLYSTTFHNFGRNENL